MDLNKKRFRFVSLVMVLAFVILAAGCGGQKPAPQGTGGESPKGPVASVPSNVSKDELVVAMGSLPPILNPYQYFTPPNIIPYYALYDAPTIIDVNDGAKVKPNLATDWQQISDTVWEFKLREDVTFANGEELDAETVKFSMDYLMNPELALPVVSRLNTIAGLTVVDKYVFQVETKAVDPLLPARMAVLFVLPPKAFSAADPAEFFQKPFGTGPFVVSEFVQGEKLVFEANPSSWRGAPALKKVTLQSMPDASSRLNALKSGDVDLVHKLPTDQAASMESAGFDVLSAVEAGTYIIEMYSNDGPLSDKRVRQALNYAINKEGLVQAIMGGYGTVSQGQLINPGLVGFNPELEAYPYDPQKARDLLAEAGYTDLQLTMEASNGYILNDKNLAEAVAAMLEEVGVKVNLEISEYSVFLQNWNRPRAERKDLFAWRVTVQPFMDADASLQYFTTGFAVHPGEYSNEEFDRLYKQARVTVDPVERNKLLGEAAAVLREDAPVIFVMHTPDIWAVHPDVDGITLGPDGVIRFERAVKGN